MGVGVWAGCWPKGRSIVCKTFVLCFVFLDSYSVLQGNIGFIGTVQQQTLLFMKNTWFLRKRRLPHLLRSAMADVARLDGAGDSDGEIDDLPTAQRQSLLRALKEEAAAETLVIGRL